MTMILLTIFLGIIAAAEVVGVANNIALRTLNKSIQMMQEQLTLERKGHQRANEVADEWRKTAKTYEKEIIRLRFELNRALNKEEENE